MSTFQLETKNKMIFSLWNWCTSIPATEIRKLSSPVLQQNEIDRTMNPDTLWLIVV